MGTGQVSAAGTSGRGGWGADVRETHSAVVVLLGDRAYKVKKPVDLGFLDFTTLESRTAAISRELRLNRRTAPDVYLGTLEVRDAGGTVCDHLLVMRRMPEDRRLATLVRAGVDVTVPLRQLARDLAAFHSTARTGAAVDACGSPEALRGRWVDNLRGLRQHPVDTVPPQLLDQVEQLALEFVEGRAPLLQSRIDAGLVRDGHGDLLADDVFCLEDGPRALDCLDFADELRWMDVLDDAACLATDLERLGDPRAGERFLHDYEEFSGRRQPPALRHHYTAYRAVMRAKVAAIRAGAHGLPSGPDADEVRQLLDIGLAHLLQGRVRLVLVGGGPGSGKSTLSSGLADRLGAVLMASDPERKALMGLDPTSHAPAAFGQGIYTREATARTYASLADRAAALLGLGETVVVDASFSDAAERAAFRQVGVTAHAPVAELACTAPREVLEARLLRRADVPDRHGDADLAIGRRLAAQAAPWPEAVVVPTGETTKAATLDAALRQLDR
ncbi:AAA family ATPase [Phycicoccus sp. M110.8]|uniref:bifunctional aminoglycoside phosphotransferase/ATP-binding protein n=1 Tax=Phycicoccus sp. M110.8 TaxID=3075433 RepID=UPI0028FD9EF3|nr:AAA family ATPase [Phycicoccus sp. M110.8]MDU0315440.1 AAA family ATPase [Phycicoccus sp. M110.8]